MFLKRLGLPGLFYYIKMITKKVKIISDFGLHARYGALASFAASSYGGSKCSVYINFNDRHVNMKSLLGILSVNIKKDDIIEIECTGVGENTVIDQIINDLTTNKIAVNPNQNEEKTNREEII